MFEDLTEKLGSEIEALMSELGVTVLKRMVSPVCTVRYFDESLEYDRAVQASSFKTSKQDLLVHFSDYVKSRNIKVFSLYQICGNNFQPGLGKVDEFFQPAGVYTADEVEVINNMITVRGFLAQKLPDASVEFEPTFLAQSDIDAG
jgi:hypothetical protein